MDLTLQQLLLRLGAVLVIVTVHRFVQAIIAYRLGDAKPKYDGRLTLNPFAHLDGIGTLLILVFSVGWGKPVVIDPTRSSHPRRDMLVVSVSGTLALVLLAVLLLPLRPVALLNLPNNVVFSVLGFLESTIRLSLWLAVFNLIPLPPLDAYGVIRTLFFRKPWDWDQRYVVVYSKAFLGLLILTGTVAQVLEPLQGLLVRSLGLGAW